MSETRDTDPAMYGGRTLPRRIANALNFYAMAEPALVAADGGAMAREALADACPRTGGIGFDGPPSDEARFAPVPTIYRNHAGLIQPRQIVPVALKFGSDWHPGEHVLYGLDAVKGAYREFALSGFRAWGQGAVDERTEQLVAMGRAMSALAVLADTSDPAMTAYQILADAGATPAEEVRS